MLNGMIPMCSSQYERLFNTTRVPGKEVDTLQHLADSTHIVVFHKGRYFRCGCYSNGRLLNPAELQRLVMIFIKPIRWAHHLLIRTSLHGSGRVGMFVSKNRLIPIVFPPKRGMRPPFHKKWAVLLLLQSTPCFHVTNYFKRRNHLFCGTRRWVFGLGY